MDIVRSSGSLRSGIFSLLAVLVLTACEPESGGSGEDKDPAVAPDGLSLIPPADRTSEATGMLTVVSPGSANATGGAGAYTFSHDAPANGFPLGSTVVNWTVVDGNGDESRGTQIVTMADTTAPSLSVPPNIQTASTTPTIMLNLGTATASDMAIR